MKGLAVLCPGPLCLVLRIERRVLSHISLWVCMYPSPYTRYDTLYSTAKSVQIYLVGHMRVKICFVQHHV